MILLASVIIHHSTSKDGFRVKFFDWAMLILGSCIVIYTYCEGYTRYMLKRFNISDLISIYPKKEMLDYAAMFIPVHFNWILFGVAEGFFFLAIYLIIKRTGKK
jgi:hypothetical protein